jgi:hypothetical protein
LPSYETAYSAAIGKRYPNNRFVVFAYSNIINLPVGRMAPYQPRDGIKEPAAIALSALPDIQLSRNGPVRRDIDKKATTRTKIEDTSRAKDIDESLNPEANKGIEVSLHSEKAFSAQLHSHNSAAKHYDEALINYIIHTTFSEKDLAVAFAPKIKYAAASHFTSKDASGQGSYK